MNQHAIEQTFGDKPREYGPCSLKNDMLSKIMPVGLKGYTGKFQKKKATKDYLERE